MHGALYLITTADTQKCTIVVHSECRPLLCAANNDRLLLFHTQFVSANPANCCYKQQMVSYCRLSLTMPLVYLSRLIMEQLISSANELIVWPTVNVHLHNWASLQLLRHADNRGRLCRLASRQIKVPSIEKRELRIFLFFLLFFKPAVIQKIGLRDWLAAIHFVFLFSAFSFHTFPIFRHGVTCGMTVNQIFACDLMNLF